MRNLKDGENKIQTDRKLNKSKGAQKKRDVKTFIN